MRGLGGIAEAQHGLADATDHWQQLAKTVRPGDALWYEGRYQMARLTRALGKKKEAIRSVQDLLSPLVPAFKCLEI